MKGLIFMRKKFRYISCTASVLAWMFALGSIVGNGYQPYSYLDYSPYQIQQVSADYERLQALDRYSLENYKVFSSLETDNGNDVNVILMIPDGQNVAETDSYLIIFYDDSVTCFSI